MTSRTEKRRPQRRTAASRDNVQIAQGEAALNSVMLQHYSECGKPARLAAARIAARFGCTRATAVVIAQLAGLGGRDG